MSRTWFIAAALTFVLGCEPAAPETTGGIFLDEQKGSEGGICGRGIAVFLTDYTSTNIALLDLDGMTESSSFLHSGAASVELNAPLSGDVVFPHSKMDDNLVLIDRYPAAVLTFVDFSTARVEQQIAVRTGFDANSHDYLVVDSQTALVSRYEMTTAT